VIKGSSLLKGGALEVRGRDSRSGGGRKKERKGHNKVGKTLR